MTLHVDYFMRFEGKLNKIAGFKGLKVTEFWDKPWKYTDV